VKPVLSSCDRDALMLEKLVQSFVEDMPYDKNLHCTYSAFDSSTLLLHLMDDIVSAFHGTSKNMTSKESSVRKATAVLQKSHASFPYQCRLSLAKVHNALHEMRMQDP